MVHLSEKRRFIIPLALEGFAPKRDEGVGESKSVSRVKIQNIGDDIL
jgi:hypothetical protein